MSQAGRNREGIGPTGDLETLTGDIGAAVPPTNFNINILGAPGGSIIVQGSPLLSTLFISDESKSKWEVVTTDNTGEELIVFPIPELSAYTFTGTIIATTDDFLQAGSATFSVGVRRALGDAFILGTPSIPYARDFFGVTTIGAFIMNNDFVIGVAGLPATTITWQAVMTTQEFE